MTYVACVMIGAFIGAVLMSLFIAGGGDD